MLIVAIFYLIMLIGSVLFYIMFKDDFSFYVLTLVLTTPPILLISLILLRRKVSVSLSCAKQVCKFGSECPATDELLCFLEKNERYYPYVKDISPSDIAVSLEKSSAYKALSVTREERQIVKDTFSGLGTTDLTTQLEMLDFSIMQLETALHEAQAEKRQKTRLYNSLGFMCAILVALLII